MKLSRPADIELSPAKARPAAPVTWLASDRDEPEEGLALCLSGGGTRAMLFHAGALLRLYEMDLFLELRRISSVSGGSIAAGMLALNWKKLATPTTNRRDTFRRAVIEPLRGLDTRQHLVDGGVYDNLALETVWKRYRDVLASDGGGAFSDDPRPATDLIFQSVRIMKTIDRQVRALRRNMLIRSYWAPPDASGGRRGAYWGIRTKIADYDVEDALPCPPAQTLVLANESTRLWRMRDVTQMRLINWGYAVSDAAIRAYYRPNIVCRRHRSRMRRRTSDRDLGAMTHVPIAEYELANSQPDKGIS